MEYSLRSGYSVVVTGHGLRARIALLKLQIGLDLNRRIPATPTPALDRGQEAVDLRVERRRLFQIDGVAGIGANPKTGVAKGCFQHQVGLEAGRVFIAHS